MSPQRAMYQYFLAPGHAGILLKPMALSRLLRQGIEVIEDELRNYLPINLKDLSSPPR